MNQINGDEADSKNTDTKNVDKAEICPEKTIQEHSITSKYEKDRLF